MTGRILTASLTVLLSMAVIAAAQEQTIKLTLKVEPYLELKDANIVFAGSSDSPGVFDSGWQVVALANAPWRASLVLQPISVFQGEALATGYKVFVRYNGQTRIIEISERERKRGAVTVTAGETPHNGIIEMRFVASVSSGYPEGALLAPPSGVGMMLSVTAF